MTDTTTEPVLSSDVTEVRAQKLAKLRETVAEVYPAHFHRTLTNSELAEKYADIEPDTLTGDI
ncbi:MAG: lysine--tRNA ligase, partial [Hoeflea sp.]|nr:lysine--tRNA ligase [Hoeflea sp.]